MGYRYGTLTQTGAFTSNRLGFTTLHREAVSFNRPDSDAGRARSPQKPDATVIEEIRDEGIAILLVELNSTMALSIAHRASVIDDGPSCTAPARPTSRPTGRSGIASWPFDATTPLRA